MEVFNLLRDILGFATLVFGAGLIILSRIKSENLKDLKDRVGLLEKEREEARIQHVENQKAISNLEGQLATYKEIPLKSIAASLSELASSNNKILSTLEHSALIAQIDADKGGLLVKTKKDNPLTVEVKE